VFVAVLLLSSLLNAILFFRVIERAYFEPVGDEHHALQGQIGRTIAEAPLSLLIPLLLLTAGVLSVGLLSGKIVSV